MLLGHAKDLLPAERALEDALEIGERLDELCVAEAREERGRVGRGDPVDGHAGQRAS